MLRQDTPRHAETVRVCGRCVVRENVLTDHSLGLLNEHRTVKMPLLRHLTTADCIRVRCTNISRSSSSWR